MSIRLNSLTNKVSYGPRTARPYTGIVEVPVSTPEEVKVFVAILRDRRYFIVPKNEHALENLRVLRKALEPFGSGWLMEVIGDVLDPNDPSNLSDWANLLENAGFTEFVPAIEEKLQAAIAASVKVCDLDALLAEKSRQLFTTKRRTGGALLTELQFTPDIAMTSAEALGVRYDVYKMIDAEKYRPAVEALTLHTGLLGVLQGAGFPKMGLEGQSPLKTSKSALLKFVEANPGVLNGIRTQTGAGTPERGWVDALMAGRDPASLNKLAGWLNENLLDRGGLIQARAGQDRFTQLQSQCRWTLDPWQMQMIQAIQRGDSVIALTPTSAGKTFTAMSAIECLLNTEEKTRLAYVAPTFDLAFQIFNNIKRTFPSKRISLITMGAAEPVAETQIWVGTPTELFVYLSTTGERFNVGIFDEIHTISTTFATDRASVVRAEAIANLLGFATDVGRRRQIIALSATINQADVTGSILNNFIIQRAGVPVLVPIIETTRPVPQTSYLWNGTRTVPLGGTVPNVPVTPAGTFDFLRQLVAADRAPVLTFDASPIECYDNFVAYVDWVEHEEAREYALWSELRQSFEGEIEALNSELREVAGEAAEKLSKGETKHLSGNVSKAIAKRGRLLETIRRRIASTILNHLEEKAGIEVEVTSKHEVTLSKLGALKVPSEIGVQIADLLDEYEKFAVIQADGQLTLGNLGTLPFVCESVGSYYRIGEASNEVSKINRMFNPSSATDLKLRLEMLKLCAAERIREEEIKPLFRLIAKGLAFGVGIILPTMPFVVRFHMLKLLSSKALKAVFSSQEMSMGINYPIRTVCIRSNTPLAMDVCLYLQMSGRSGRRRLDTEGFVVAWNITNALTATPANLPRIAFPEFGSQRGCQITDPLTLALEIDVSRSYTVGNVDMTAVISKLAYASDRQGASKRSMRAAIYGEGAEGDESEAPIQQEVKREAGEDVRHPPGASREAEDEEDDEEDDEVKAAKAAAEQRIAASGFDEVALASAVGGCIAPLAQAIGLQDAELLAIADRVQFITQGRITEEMKIDAYQWAQKIALVKAALQELHTRFHLSSHDDWLSYIASIFELMHRVQLRQMRL